MDYRVLIENFFHGTTSHDEEDMLRRYLKEENLPADILEQKEMLLAMLQPSEYECSEAMDEISAMIDRLAVQEVEKRAVVATHKPATRMVLMRYVYSAMAVVALIALLLITYPYGNDCMQQPTAPIVAVVVEEPAGNDSANEQPIVAENAAGAKEHGYNINVKNDVPEIAVPLVTEPENALVANVSKEKTETGETRNVYIGAVNTDVRGIPGYDPNLSNTRAGYQVNIDKGLTAMAGTKSSNKNVLKRRNGIYLGGWGGILSEPPIKTDSLLHLSDILAGMEPDHFANPADAARLVEMRDSIRTYSAVVEMMLQAQNDKDTVGNEQVLTMDDVEFAPEDFPWSPASPLHIYSIRNKGNETVVTFLCSICFRSQSMPFSKDIYAQDEDNGDIYNVIGYAGGHSMERNLVVNGCSGRNILVSLRFPKFKRKVKRISIYSPGHKDDIKPSNDRDIKVFAENVDVKKMRKLYKLPKVYK